MLTWHPCLKMTWWSWWFYDRQTDLWTWWRTLHVTKCHAFWILLILIQIPLQLPKGWHHFSSDSHPCAEREPIVKLWILSNLALILPEILYKLLIHADSHAVGKTFTQLHEVFQTDSTLIYIFLEMTLSVGPKYSSADWLIFVCSPSTYSCIDMCCRCWLIISRAVAE